MAKQVIDMRSRPAFLHDFYGKTPGTKDYEVVKWLNGRVGSKEPEHFTRSKDVASFADEIKASGITTSVVVGRDTCCFRSTTRAISWVCRCRSCRGPPRPAWTW